MRVLIAGASGMIGRELTTLCMNEPKIDRVFMLVRKPMAFEHDKLHQIVVDYDTISEKDIPEKIDVVYCCLGTTIKKAKTRERFRQVDFEYVVELANLAKFKKVEKFIAISAMGANRKSSMFYNRVKGEMEDYLMNDLKMDNVFILRPSLLLGNREEYRLGEKIATVLMTLINVMFIGNLRMYKAIPAKTVAKAMMNLSKMNESGRRILLNDALFTIAEATD
ncbi:MAG: NAD(P)H-binding protein [Flavobacteriales bacterium]|nr:NAD(P)H-binding protein [Flavobacteriales bacterium]